MNEEWESENQENGIKNVGLNMTQDHHNIAQQLKIKSFG
jgi:hypothetical protein